MFFLKRKEKKKGINKEKSRGKIEIKKCRETRNRKKKN